MPTHNNVSAIIHRVVDVMNGLSVKTFNVPPQTLLGGGSITKIGDVLYTRNIKKVFIAIDAYLHEIGLADGMYRALDNYAIEYECFLQERGEPDTALVERMTEALRASKCKASVAFGGGSVIDALKAALIIEANGHLPLMKLGSNITIKPHDYFFIAVPTTAGTGSEATDVTVITDNKQDIKHVLAHECLIPNVAVMDACLTIELPPFVTAATGIDALTHAIEAYVGKKKTPLTQALAHRAISLIAKALPIVVGQGDNIQAREDMMLASYMAGISFSNAGLGLSHAMAHRLGPAYNIAHGTANAIMLPSIMKFNLLVCKQEYAEIGFALTGEIISAEETIQAIQALILSLGLPKNLQEVGGDSADFYEFAEEALCDICLTTNPRNADKTQIMNVFQDALSR